MSRSERVVESGVLELAQFVRDGDHIVIGQSSGEPQTLTEALLAQAAQIGRLDEFLGATSFNTFTATVAPSKVSRITTALNGPVTTGAADVDIVVTEWGIAQLKGVDFATRKQRLMALAHPQFRAALAAG